MKEKKSISTNLLYLVQMLHLQKVIAYPTESVFGLGCDPDSKVAVEKLLQLKKRSWKKGLILIAAEYSQLVNYIDQTKIQREQLAYVFSYWPGAITWLFPAKAYTPYWITGGFHSIAVRISSFEPVRQLCLAFGKPLISTSANLSGLSPARTQEDVVFYFGKDLPIMNKKIQGNPYPSEIRDVLTKRLIRNGNNNNH
ncbi:Sua5/YciO/YrdC/YwlC family protein [Candidatus Schneideria nysicola]|uniref:Sua5/YciO/YrdC/YwlC family protein n=1 Tax=Candidatus Schneideria nysicola TaxID=1081631 RepID=UPI001CAA595F|nr:Sua5/YciO/YrdC/YwlC family protein [Candidatus Schneideria nysicola]UAJ65231.1 Sua5/YciO/YrdC/YwlC family protein [Candidatus Schneideria nysicola]UAJ65768.1 Sua5/YciO/YrdC/YwlC family protein [Candidatus Schneideria nysicola]UAJ66295.1 Sua5/YciO/YrdC/YwlC family protein [Candidatus Schneideria nysicola]